MRAGSRTTRAAELASVVVFWASLLFAAPLLSAGSGGSPRVELVDSADRAGFTVVTFCGGAEKNHILESTGSGVLLLDYDGDGFLDVYFVNAERFLPGHQVEPHSNVLYRNQGDGTFRDVTREAGVGLQAFGAGGAVADFDNDGLPDIYVTNWGANVLLRNRGDGTFEDVTARTGVGDPRWSLGAAFFDADGDGNADLFVANYIETSWDQVWTARRIRRWRGKVNVLDGPRGLKGSPNRFYHNNGDGTFREATEAAGFATGSDLYSMGVVSFDYDNDGDVDLYVANDSTPNALYRNRGDGTFEEVAALAGCAYNADGASQGSMGVDFGDFDGDGLFDLVVTNFAHDYYTLYRNLGGGLFVDYSFVSNLAVPSFAPLGWGTHFLDVDRDGDLDIFASNGHIYPQVEQDPTLHETYKQTNLLLLNQGGKLENVTATAGSGLAVVESSRGSAVGDLDNDGDLDIVVSNQDQRPTYLENRTEGAGHWVEIELIDSVGTRQALGARVDLQASGRTQIREVAAGGAYASANDPRLHFGIGADAVIEKLVITWLDGTRETYDNLPADAGYRVRRGSKPMLISEGAR